MFNTLLISSFFFFNDTATTEIYTLSLHDSLPISLLASQGRGTTPSLRGGPCLVSLALGPARFKCYALRNEILDRKSTRLNSSHLVISYAVFCLKKKKKRPQHVDLRGRVPIRSTR